MVLKIQQPLKSTFRCDMFIPLILLKNEKPLVTVGDCVRALDRHLTSRYPTWTTSNPEYTKAECFCILQCYFQAGKFMPSLDANIVNTLVGNYIMDKFWIDAYKILVRHDLDPATWLKFY